MHRKKFILVVLVCFSSLRGYCQFVNGIRAIVNDSLITDFQIRVVAENALDLLRTRYAGRPDEFQQQVQQTLQNALDQLVERRLIVHEFESSKYIIPEAVIDEALRARIREVYGGDRATLIKTLQSQGLTVERLRQQIRDQIVVSAMVQKHVGSMVIVSPRKIEQYYEQNREKFRLQDRIKLRMIMLDQSTEPNPETRLQLALRLHSMLRDGTAFAELASKYGTPSTRARGGDWGWAQRNELMLGLADVAFDLAPGNVSPVLGYARDRDGYWLWIYAPDGKLQTLRHYVTGSGDTKEHLLSQYGPDDKPDQSPVPPEIFYILYVEAKQPAGYKPLSEVQSEIEQTLLVEERARLQKRWIDKLRAKAFVRYF